MPLPIISHADANDRLLSAYVGEPAWGSKSIRVSFYNHADGHLSFFVHGFNACVTAFEYESDRTV